MTVNRESLKVLLESERVKSDAYSIDGTERDESVCLRTAVGGWSVYYSERGLRSDERLFETEDEACQFIATRLLGNPGNRVPPT